MTSAFSTGITPLPTLADINRAIDQVGKLKFDSKWTLISPDARAWQGTPEEMIAVLAPHHRLLKPMSLAEIFEREKKETP